MFASTVKTSSQSLRHSFLLITAVSWIAGCNPNTDVQPKSADNTVSNAADIQKEPTNETANVAPNASAKTIIITGDLNSVNWNSNVGRQVVIEGDLVIVDTYDLIRRGQIKVARDRLYIPTSLVDPNDADPNSTSIEGGSNVAKVTEAQKYNDHATITLDDGSAKQNVFPPELLPSLGKQHKTVRVGSVIHGVTGQLVKAGNRILLVPNGPLEWSPSPRPPRPSVGDAAITIASFNVLNYFTTIDDGRNNARGADSQSELKRQEAKIVSAIVELDADVIGLMELENNVGAEQRLVDAVNEKIGMNVFRVCGVPDKFSTAPGGSDTIRVGIIYRSDKVAPDGSVKMIHDNAFWSARTPIMQSFKPKNGDSPFAVIVNHFKSKGSAEDANPANKKKGDGQGAYNAARRAQSLAICRFIDGLKEKSPQPRVLVIGDLNAYQQEDPIDVLRAKGLVDLHEQFDDPRDSKGTAEHYSYIYYGQSGSLDHAFATQAFAKDVTGIATWHINADEPRFLDYNEEYNPKPLYQPDPFRSSDHDPVLIGIGK